jgi:hypothetical protein
MNLQHYTDATHNQGTLPGIILQSGIEHEDQSQ